MMDGFRILGVDPGLNITGYGVLSHQRNGCQLIEAGVVRGSDSRTNLTERLQSIHQGIAEVIEQCRPSVMAVEKLFSHYQRPRTAILMGHARGVICLAAGIHNVPLVGYSATQVKRILTGSGRAPKQQVQQAIQRELGLPELPQPADVADALAIALCHFHLEANRPATNVTSTTPNQSHLHLRRSSNSETDA